ncbi:cullin-associated NEDD8-dissociated protein 1 [Elysia marginata]|uniref:Cullin-associated NEDD8-dissociated protein 1 n=1 Tax=Elysia marginata TaxID=1093978 RepID=A0AAV4ER49_9GAST|nr:cullin-associated NEDD8-dissociated protein 1 [Elysia marginata]
MLIGCQNADHPTEEEHLCVCACVYRESEDEYSDDDDMSWKVRRSAAKCLEAIVSTRHDMLPEFYKTVSPALIARFKEREENVKSDIFHAYIALLKQTRPVIVAGADSMEEEEGPLNMLQNQVADVVRAIHRQLREKSIKTRQGCFSLLTELVLVLPGALDQHLASIMPGIQYSLSDKNSSSNMKIDTLSFLNTLLANHSPSVFHPHIKMLVPPIVNAVADPFYKITSEALLVTQQLVKVLRPLDSKSAFDYKPYVKSLYSCTVKRLKAADIDQEEEGFPILASFLRKNQRALKLSTLQCLDVVVRNYSGAINASMLSDVMKEMPPLINENDLHISQLSLNLLTSISRSHKQAMSSIQAEILPQILVLVQSPLLQGGALNAVLDFFRALITLNLPKLGFRDLLSKLITPVYDTRLSSGPIHRQAYHSIARCVAALTEMSPLEASNVVAQFISDIKNPKSTELIVLFSLLALGEIGKNIDLSPHRDIQNVILDCFSSLNEEVKSAASFALGNVSVGNLPKFLPFVLQEIENQPKRQYLLLHSLKEIINCESSSQTGVEILKSYVQTIWTMLFHNCECPEEGTRNVVSECMGKLTLVDPHTLIASLQQHLSDPSPLARSTVVTAIKFTISDQPQPIDPLLKSCIGDFLRTLQDEDLTVRRVALVTFNSAAHNKPSLIRDLLETVLPHLYNETKVRKELIREVEMGPFKHTLDDGLDIRKAAFECMYTLLDSCLDRLDIFEFLNHVEDGLKDHYDIKMLTYLMLVRLSHLCPSAVLQRLDRLVEPIRATCTTKVKAHSVKQEYEKQEELKRSALRAVVALLNIPDSDKSPQMNDFMSHIKATPELAVMYDTIQKDALSSGQETMAMDTS